MKRVKKVAVLSLVIGMLLTLAGCAVDNEEKEADDDDVNVMQLLWLRNMNEQNRLNMNRINMNRVNNIRR